MFNFLEDVLTEMYMIYITYIQVFKVLIRPYIMNNPIRRLNELLIMLNFIFNMQKIIVYA